MRELPILFNTKMVDAILTGKKTVTRRLLKPQPELREGETGKAEILDDGNWTINIEQYRNMIYEGEYKPPYEPGDILYVRETWQYTYDSDKNGTLDLNSGRYVYVADNFNSLNSRIMPDGTEPASMPWRPSIHMPKEAARIFLKVTNVRLEQLRDIELDPPGPNNEIVREGFRYGGDFIAVWENLCKASERSIYGYYANPWVWVIEFERCDKPSK